MGGAFRAAALALALCVTWAVAMPQREANAVVIDETNDTGSSPYSYSFRTSNGISREESGSEAATGGAAARGAYTWTSPEGYTYTITYTAGENGRGYHAKVPQLLPGPATPRGGPSGFPWA